MGNTNIDTITKGILDKSRIELTDPGFSRIVMNKIMLEERRKFFIRNILSWFFIVVTVAVFVYLSIQISQLNNIDFASLLSGLNDAILRSIEKAEEWIVKNEYFILPVIVILIFKKIIDSRMKYS